MPREAEHVSLDGRDYVPAEPTSTIVEGDNKWETAIRVAARQQVDWSKIGTAAASWEQTF